MKPQLKDEAQHAIEELEVLTGRRRHRRSRAGRAGRHRRQGDRARRRSRSRSASTSARIRSRSPRTASTRSSQADRDPRPRLGPRQRSAREDRDDRPRRRRRQTDDAARSDGDHLRRYGRRGRAPVRRRTSTRGCTRSRRRGTRTSPPPKQIQVEKKGTYNEMLELHVQGGDDRRQRRRRRLRDRDRRQGRRATASSRGRRPRGRTRCTVTQARLRTVQEGPPRPRRPAPRRKRRRSRRRRSRRSRPPHDWTGVYSQLNFVGLFEVDEADERRRARARLHDRHDDRHLGRRRGRGSNVRVGYSFGYVGIEGSVLLGYDHSDVERQRATERLDQRASGRPPAAGRRTTTSIASAAPWRSARA